jgi:hypothetical protein
MGLISWRDFMGWDMSEKYFLLYLKIERNVRDLCPGSSIRKKKSPLSRAHPAALGQLYQDNG